MVSQDKINMYNYVFISQVQGPGSILSFGCSLCIISHVLSCPKGFLKVLWFLPNYQNHACSSTGYEKLHLGMKEWMFVCMLPCDGLMSCLGCVSISHPVSSVVIIFLPSVHPSLVTDQKSWTIVDPHYPSSIKGSDGKWQAFCVWLKWLSLLVLPQLSRPYPLPGAMCCSAGVMQFKCKSGGRDRGHDGGHSGNGHPQRERWQIESLHSSL